MSQPEYLSAYDVVSLHDNIVRRMTPVCAPLLFPDRLESAIQRPRNVAYYEGADLIHQAVVLAIGISQSQAFEDGNKRAGFAAADTFLYINGWVFVGNQMEMAKRLESVANASGNETRDAQTKSFITWLRSQVITKETYHRNLSGQPSTGDDAS